MLNFMTVPPDSELAAQMVKKRLEEHFKLVEGVCYYRHSMGRTKNNLFPDFTVFSRVNQPLIIRIAPYKLEEIEYVDDGIWVINNISVEEPFLDLGDITAQIDSQFHVERKLRNILKPQGILALPFIIQRDFEKIHGPLEKNPYIIWAGGDSHALFHPLMPPLSDKEWKLTRSVIQGVSNLHSTLKSSPTISNIDEPTTINTLGAAITQLDKDIMALDEDQEAAVIKIAPGPQRIRGLAGTGKTVLLAVKAAEIHLQNPDKKILFTFYTRSLYNQIKDFISKAYRTRTGEDPNWDLLHIRHAWGGKDRSGVYSELCARQGVQPLSFDVLRRLQDPFQRCCQQALEKPIYPEYDFILVDEAQDFPKEFFRVLYKLSFSEHRICWAYDELQSLSVLEIPKPEDLFGKDANGKSLVSLDGFYPQDIEKDIVLRRSYRCPLPVLMLAHAIGLGIKSSKGCVQMLENKSDWEAFGYEIQNGRLQQGEDVVIYRPETNSPNRIYEIYNKQELITTHVFSSREDELSWIADSIRKDIKEEKVAPQKIVVISLDQKTRSYFEVLKEKLVSFGIASVAPGVFDGPDAFAVENKVTLANVHRAKGNEMHIVYILGFDALYDYVEGIGNRNRAFASITRSKAWVRITGTGRNMVQAREEIGLILSDLPRFKFTFPDMNKIRRLGAESSKRGRVVANADKSTKLLIEVDPDALASIDIEKLKKLQEKLNEVISESL